MHFAIFGFVLHNSLKRSFIRISLGIYAILISLAFINPNTLLAQRIENSGPTQDTLSRISPLSLVLICDDIYLSGAEEIKNGGVVYHSDDMYYRIQIRRTEDIQGTFFLNLFDIQPDGIVNFSSTEFYFPPRDSGVAVDLISIPLAFEFYPPYGMESFITIFSREPVSYQPNGRSSGLVVYHEDIQWLKSGELPLSLQEGTYYHRLDFEIRPMQMEEGVQTTPVFVDSLPEKTSPPPPPPTESSHKRRRLFGRKKNSNKEILERRKEVEERKKKVIVLEEIKIEGEILVDEDFDEHDAHRGRIPSSKRFVKYPILVMNNPQEPSVDLERGGKSDYIRASTKAYVISGNVTCLKNMDKTDVEIKTIRNEAVVDSYFIDATYLRRTPQSMYFEKEVHLLPGITELEVRAIGENGYSVFETFELSYSPDSSIITEGKDHLIVLGIDDYESWPDLENAVNDAKSVVSSLVSFYGIDSSNVHTLFNSSCTRMEIDNLFFAYTQSYHLI